MNTDEILDKMEELFPNAHCELNHSNAVELVIAVVLSAQTTDEAVNKVTPALFAAYPTLDDYDKADVEDIAAYIKRIGLYRNKARHVKRLTHQIKYEYHGEVPSDMNELTKLAGVGRKTANVVQSVWFGIPAFAVDTHVERISKRLGLAKPADDVLTVEKKLKRKIKRERWNKGHHLFIFFGRYFCTARNPRCEECPFVSICKKDKLDAYKSLLKNKKIN
ncbi:MAG TPA: endonuclease III [Candidatus Merdenecus merdavium]|nr:endonuclease III [Candidatus Merdenecus merdavium]